MSPLLWIPVVCLVAIMFFSAAEMAFIAADRIRMRHLAEAGHRTAAEYLEAFRRPERTLATAMMGVTIAHVVASSAATVALLPALGGWTPVLVTLGLTPVALVFGEILPKALAREWATALVLRLYRPLTWTAVLLAPFAAFAHGVVAWLLRAFRASLPDSRQFVSREELKALLALEPGEADVTTQEAEMIGGIFGLGDTTVREVMVPLVDVVMLPDTASPRDAIALIRDRGFSRLPVYRQRETNIVGVVTAMDLLRRAPHAQTVAELMRAPYYVPETKRIDELLRELRRARIHMAIVVDEYGGSTGIVTLEDILEEIVGEIHDEHDRPPTAVERLPDGTFWVAGRASIDELNELLPYPLPKEAYETMAGLVLTRLGRIPRRGEQLQIPGYTVTVLEADARRVTAVKLAPHHTPDTGPSP